MEEIPLYSDITADSIESDRKGRLVNRYGSPTGAEVVISVLQNGANI